jgi:Aldo/keto reductase family
VYRFTALAQGLLTDRYINGVPADSRAAQGKSLDPNSITDESLARVGALNEIAKGRGRTLAQMALAWVLRDPRMTSTLIGASSVKQLEGNVAAVQRLEFSSDELAEIDRYPVESGVDLWAEAREMPAVQTTFCPRSTLPVPPHSSNAGGCRSSPFWPTSLAMRSGGGLSTGDPGQRG